MANKRMISGQFWEDEFFTVLPLFDRLLWIGQITACADDQGRFQDNAALIRSKVFPMDDIRLEDIENTLVRIAEAGKIVRYAVNGKRMIQIVNWWKHQQPNWAMKSVYPPPPGWVDRERYTTTNRVIITVNWNQVGGYPNGYILEYEHEHIVQYPSEQYKNKNNDNVNDNEYESPEFSKILEAFVQATGIPEFSGNNQVWVESIKKLVSMGVRPEDIPVAVGINVKNGLAMVSPKSILETAKTAIAWRTSGVKQDKPKTKVYRNEDTGLDEEVTIG